MSHAPTRSTASKPNQLWSWDITWLPTVVRGVYLHLYLVMDVWSRKVVGWRIAEADSAEIASELITQACRDGNVEPRGLVLHSARIGSCLGRLGATTTLHSPPE